MLIYLETQQCTDLPLCDPPCPNHEIKSIEPLRNRYVKVSFEINDIKVLTGTFEKIHVQFQETNGHEKSEEIKELNTTFNGDKGSFVEFEVDEDDLIYEGTDQPFKMQLGREYILHYTLYSSWKMFSNVSMNNTDDSPILHSYKCMSKVIKDKIMYYNYTRPITSHTIELTVEKLLALGGLFHLKALSV